MGDDFLAGKQGLHAVRMAHRDQLVVESFGVAQETLRTHGQQNVLDASWLWQDDAIIGPEVGKALDPCATRNQRVRRLVQPGGYAPGHAAGLADQVRRYAHEGGIDIARQRRLPYCRSIGQPEPFHRVGQPRVLQRLIDEAQLPRNRHRRVGEAKLLGYAQPGLALLAR